MRAWALWLACWSILLGVAHGQPLRLTPPLRSATNEITLKWTSAVAGQAYTVQSRDRLSSGLWLTIDAPQPWPTMQTQWVETISSASPTHFYRVVAVPPATRGKLLSSNLLAAYTTTQLNALFGAYGIPLTAQYAVKAYKLVYETIDPLGGRTQASGAQFLPQSVGKALPLLSYQHGTETLTNDVASRANNGEYPIGLVFASAGYATVLPDYLGMGDSPGFHPYVHARSEATACVDMLRAAKRYCASNSIALNGQIFLAGYSQGGHATMALHRELEKYHTNEFSITASAPMAGPYDMSGVGLQDILSSRCPPNPYYYAYVVTAYQRVYGLAGTWSSIFASPYDTTIPPLFNGNTSGSTINAYLPGCSISSMLTPALRSALEQDPDCVFIQALRDNDVDHWTPLAPLHMYHCAADADVPYANSQVAYSNFLARGATQTQFIDPYPSGDHDSCFLPSVSSAKGWFDSLKQ